MDHVKQLEAIDQEQRRQENMTKNNETENTGAPFAKPIEEALQHDDNAAPLLSQEELETEDPPRINWTAVICTALVLAAAVIILCVARPWDKGTTSPTDEAIEEPVATEPANPDQAQPAAPVADTVANNDQPQAEPEPAPEPATEPEPEPEPAPLPTANSQQPTASSLPLTTVTNTGTNNKYNSIRLIDASSRVLTVDEVKQMTSDELRLARNAIYARHGYLFKDKELAEFFKAQRWFKETTPTLEGVAAKLTKTENANIKRIQTEEAARKKK